MFDAEINPLFASVLTLQQGKIRIQKAPLAPALQGLELHVAVANEGLVIRYRLGYQFFDMEGIFR